MRVEDVTAMLIDALAPDLGPTMARASVIGIATRLGLVGSIAEADVERLLEAVVPGLTVFVGRDEALRIVDEVRQRVGEGSTR